METLDESLETTDQAPISEALDQLLSSQYRLYQEALQKVEERQHEHLLFMDRWVHQMKTPLSVIELTARTLDEPESSSIREETDRMRNGLNTVLYMARLRTIAEDFQIKDCQINIEEMSTTFNQQYGEEKIGLNGDFKILDDWQRDLERISRGLVRMEKANIMMRNNPSQLLLKGAGKLFGSMSKN
ncbi:histidine kinase dimerization/phospho-acceptor domain-containing protein, partial [Piscibacillus halophilus]|uniref:histidine kinase dimerization/phospho-acceptor domain-containing protein n=1 Tax=Piscibacillus halophilus TaxID=571933 RepID=UPI0030C737A8